MGLGRVLNSAGDFVEGIGKVSSDMAQGSIKAGKFMSKPFLRNATKVERAEAGFAGDLIKKRLTLAGAAVVTAGTMGVATANEIGNSGMTKFNRLGDISVGENLDRLISYDGSGFVDSINSVSQGDPEVMNDIVKNTFSQTNQFGASGDLVFALHNRREG